MYVSLCVTGASADISSPQSTGYLCFYNYIFLMDVHPLGRSIKNNPSREDCCIFSLICYRGYWQSWSSLLLASSIFIFPVGGCHCQRRGNFCSLSVSNSIGMIKHTDYHGFICQHQALLPQLYSVTILDVIVWNINCINTERCNCLAISLAAVDRCENEPQSESQR